MAVFIFALYIIILLSATAWALNDSSRHADGTDNPDWYRCMFLHAVSFSAALIGGILFEAGYL